MKWSLYQWFLDHIKHILIALIIVYELYLCLPPLLFRADISKWAFREINTAAIENILKRDYSRFDGSYMDGKCAGFSADWEGYSNPGDMIDNNIYVWVTVEEQTDKTPDKVKKLQDYSYGNVKMTRGFYFSKGYIYNDVCLTKNGVQIFASEKTKTAHSKHLQQAITDVLTALGAFETTETDSENH